MSQSRLDSLNKRKEAIEAQIRATKARQKNQERKRETRRKVLIGAAALYRAETDEAFARELNRMLDGFLSRDDERVLFDLPRKGDASPEAKAA